MPTKCLYGPAPQVPGHINVSPSPWPPDDGSAVADYPPLAQFAGHKHKLKNFFKFMFVAGELRKVGGG